MTEKQKKCQTCSHGCIGGSLIDNECCMICNSYGSEYSPNADEKEKLIRKDQLNNDIEKAFGFIYKYLYKYCCDDYGKFIISTDEVDKDGNLVRYKHIWEDDFYRMFENEMKS